MRGADPILGRPESKLGSRIGILGGSGRRVGCVESIEKLAGVPRGAVICELNLHATRPPFPANGAGNGLAHRSRTAAPTGVRPVAQRVDVAHAGTGTRRDFGLPTDTRVVVRLLKFVALGVPACGNGARIMWATRWCRGPTDDR